MNLQVTIKQAGKVVKTAEVSVAAATPLLLSGPLAPSGSPFPAGHPLIILQQGKVFLQLARGMDLTLTRGATTVGLADLRKKGMTSTSGAIEQIALPDGVTSQITIADWSISIVAASLRPVTAAPQGARPAPPPAGIPAGPGGIAMARDIFAPYRIFSETGRMTTFMKVATGSLLFHLIIIIFFSTRVIVSDPFLDEIPERYAKFILPPKEEPKAVEAASAPKAKEAVEEKAVDEPAKQETAQEKTETVVDEVQRKAELREKVKRSGLLGIIGSQSGAGALQDVLKDGSLTGDLDEALKNVKGGLGVAKTGDDLKSGGTRGGSAYGTADIGAIKTGGPGRSGDLGDRAATAVKSDIQTGELTATGALDSAAIAAVVRSKISGIKYCYERELKNNPKLAGRVLVSFTIGETGDVVAYAIANTTLNNAEAEQCMLRMIRRWKFPAPSGGQVTVEYPFIFTATG